MSNNFLIAFAIAWLITSVISILLCIKIDGHKPDLDSYIIALCIGPFAMVIFITAIVKYKFMVIKRKKNARQIQSN